jgi:hypothetical protein
MPACTPEADILHDLNVYPAGFTAALCYTATDASLDLAATLDQTTAAVLLARAATSAIAARAVSE